MKLRTKVVARMAELAADPNSPWEGLASHYGLTIRRIWTHDTPDWANWPEPTYQTLTFLTVVGDKIIMGTSSGPWMGRNDRDIPLWLAEAILEDPELSQDSHRINEMRHARRGGRSGDGVKR